MITLYKLRNTVLCQKCHSHIYQQCIDKKVQFLKMSFKYVIKSIVIIDNEHVHFSSNCNCILRLLQTFNSNFIDKRFLFCCFIFLQINLNVKLQPKSVGSGQKAARTHDAIVLPFLFVGKIKNLNRHNSTAFF